MCVCVCVCVCVLFRKHGKVLHNANLSKFEHTFKATVSEKTHVSGAHKTVMMMMTTTTTTIIIIIILLK